MRAMLSLLVCTGLLTLSACAQQVEYKLQHTYSTDDPQFLWSVGNLLGPPLTSGNSVETFVNGDQIFPPMLEAIRSAKKSVDFETYDFWAGDIGRQFADAFTTAAKNGAQVNVIIDWMGGMKIDQAYLNEMKSAGVRVYKFHPFIPWAPDSYQHLDHRNHRKLLIVDGTVGFTGGVGIADEWTGHAQDPKHWRDNHYRVHGPAVAQLQAAFGDSWTQTTGEVLDGPDYYPRLEQAGSQYAQVFHSTYKNGADTMQLLMLLSITAARHSIRIESAYFVPDHATRAALIAAAKRGVSVEIITPGPHTDSPIVLSASRANWKPMLDAGIKIYTFQPTMLHAKMLVVDERWSSVGSANIDNRSFHLNDEANLSVYDRDFARRQLEIFEADKQQSRLHTPRSWLQRNPVEHVADPVSNIAGKEL